PDLHPTVYAKKRGASMPYHVATSLVAADGTLRHLDRLGERPRAVPRECHQHGRVSPLEAAELYPGDVHRSVKRAARVVVHRHRIVIGELAVPAPRFAVPVPLRHLDR